MKNKNLLLIGAAVAAYFLFMRKGTSSASTSKFSNLLPPGEGDEMMDSELPGGGGGPLSQAQTMADTAKQTVELAQGTVQTAVQTFARTPEQKAAAAQKRAAAKSKRVQRRKATASKRLERRAAAKARRAQRRAKRSMGEIDVM